MILDRLRFIYRIPVLNRFFLNLIIYLANIRVRVCFSDKPYTKSLIIFGGIAGFFFFLILFRVFFHMMPSHKNAENKATYTQLKAPKEKTYQSSRFNKKPKLKKHVLEDSKAVSIQKKENETAPLISHSPPSDLQEISSQSTLQTKKIKQNNISRENIEIISTKKEKKEKITHYMRVNANRVNVRETPILESDIIAKLGQGFIVKRLSRKGDWIQADSGGGLKGWVYHDLLEDVSTKVYQLWRNNPNSPATISLINKGLDDPQTIEREKEKIKKLLISWKLAWEAKNLDKFISFYSKAFTKSKYNWESFKAYKKSVFKNSGNISVGIKNIEIKFDNYFISAFFDQTYQSDTIHSTVKKMLNFQLEKDGWKIATELVITKK